MTDTAAIVLHPHPGMGGDRDHPLVVAVTDGLAATDITAWRVDLTDPNPDVSTPALEGLAAQLVEEAAAGRLLLVGYSWGAAISVRAQHEHLQARVLVAPPVAMLPDRPAVEVPTLVLVPAHDQFGSPEAIEEHMAGWPDTTVEVVDGCDHFLVGAVDRIARRAVSWATAG